MFEELKLLPMTGQNDATDRDASTPLLNVANAKKEEYSKKAKKDILL